MKYAVNLIKNDIPVPGRESVVSGPNRTTTISGTAIVECERGDRIGIHTQILEGSKRFRYVGEGCSITVTRVRLN